MATSLVGQMYDMILLIPGMMEAVKIDLRISRKSVLLLSSVIERGLSGKDDEKDGGILASIPEDALVELKTIAQECLEKAGLTDLSSKLKLIGKDK
ncbi:hypothetical protein [Pedobacter xixiisoli]|uniref:Uncharacterized protein n=1 Tax=Pedobacter xixiisoli TaxID=1476464 RepID=A0A286A7E1_9SPHI|nr:hypothetical protein [Pedobacter xixiisoli]SOD17751.1 hypothetical protein SAMN06297358_2669 [Pedobacter xixiisoli]